MTERMVNGQILKAMQSKINSALDKKLSVRDRDMYEMYQLFTMFLVDDHNKTATMWKWFQPLAWIAGIAATTIIITIASGRVYIDVGFIK